MSGEEGAAAPPEALERPNCEEQGAGWEWCESLRECIHGHVQTCPAEGPDGAGVGLRAVAGGEKSALEELLSTNAAKVSVALLCVFIVNEIAKSFVRRQGHARKEAERLEALVPSADAAAKAEWTKAFVAENEKVAEAVGEERREEERLAKLADIERKRKKYGMKDWKQAAAVGGEGAEEHDVRARQVAEQDAAAPEREAALALQAERAKEARLAQIERQRKAYGLLPKGTALGVREEEAASDRPLSLAEQQDAEYAAALQHDLQAEADAEAAARARQAEEEAALAALPSAPEEPEPGAAGATAVRFRLPSGELAMRRFLLSDPTVALWDFLLSADGPEEVRGEGRERLALYTAFPRRRLEAEGDSAVLEQALGAGGAVLTVELASP